MPDLAFSNQTIGDVYDSYSKAVKTQLLLLRQLIFKLAAEEDAIGKIEETLKWGEPSYLTHKPKSGTTIRLSPIKKDNHKIAIFVHCQTTLIADFKAIFPDLDYDGNRAIIFDSRDKIPVDIIEEFFYMALTYHARKS